MNTKVIMEKFRRAISYLMILLLVVTMATGCSQNLTDSQKSNVSSKDREVSQRVDQTSDKRIDRDSTYTTKEDVARYIAHYKELPKNFISKEEAKNLGWNKSENYVSDVAKGKSIGGDRFGNFEKQLPIKKGRVYRECDIDYRGGKRGPKRIIFSNDGLIYYTGDHYKTFEKLYGEDE